MSDNFINVSNGLNLQPISSDPANPVEGDLQFSDGTHRTKGIWQYESGTWKQIATGSGGGGLDVFDTEDFSNLSAVNNSGNNASFLGGGTLSGSFSIESASPLSGTKSGKYTAGAASTNDYIELKTIDLDLKQRSQDIKVRLLADMSGFSNDVTFVIYDKTNLKLLTDSLDIMPASGNRTFYEFSVFVPSNCAQISYGFHMKAGAVNTESFLFDDIEFSTNPFVTKKLLDRQYLKMEGSSGHGSTNTKIRKFTSVIVDDNPGNVYTYNNDAANGFSITFNRDAEVHISYVDLFNTGTDHGLSINSTQLTTNLISINTADRLNITSSSGNNAEQLSWSGKVKAGDVIRPHTNGAGDSAFPNYVSFEVLAVAESDHIITPAKSNTNIFSALVDNNGTATLVSQAGKNEKGENAIQSVNRTSQGVVQINFTPGFFSEIPSVTANVSQSSSGFATVIATSTTSCSIRTTLYTGSHSDYSFDVHIARQGNDVKESSFLAAVPVQRVAYLKESTTGTFTGGAWRTRALDTISGDTEIVSLSASQFTLQPGKYKIVASAPAYNVDRHVIRLYNVTDGVQTSLGTSEFTSTTAPEVYNRSFIYDTVELISPKTFEIQHQSQGTNASVGFGVGNGYGGADYFTVVEITKIK